MESEVRPFPTGRLPSFKPVVVTLMKVADTIFLTFNHPRLQDNRGATGVSERDVRFGPDPLNPFLRADGHHRSYGSICNTVSQKVALLFLAPLRGRQASLWMSLHLTEVDILPFGPT